MSQVVTISFLFLSLTETETKTRFCPCLQQTFGISSLFSKPPPVALEGSVCATAVSGLDEDFPGVGWFTFCVYLSRRLLAISGFGFKHDCHFKC